MSLRNRYEILDSNRTLLLERYREYARNTIPFLLPREGHEQGMEPTYPFSSTAARGIVGMASKMLSAMLPLNDMPFFQLGLKDGRNPTQEEREYLEMVARQVHKKLTSQNLRDSLFQVLKYLITVGNCLVTLEDDYKVRLTRMDHYVTVRNILGDVVEIIYLDFRLKSDEEVQSIGTSTPSSHASASYDIFYNQVKRQDDGSWSFTKENEKGEVLETGTYEEFALPFVAARWTFIPGEHYGRAYVEEIFGDIMSLESYTEALLETLSASSTWWPAVNPYGSTEFSDVSNKPNGVWISAGQDDVHVVSPANTMRTSVQAAFEAVESMRRIVASAFLDAQGQVRHAERVTAAEIRLLGQELEQVLGGAFSNIANELFVPLVRRTIYLMIQEGQLDSRITTDLFGKDGIFDIDIITGLQALSRDNDLVKLMQMGDMMRNLPPEAAQTFKWDQYGRALVTSLGFDPNNWIKSPEEIQQEQGIQIGQQAMGQGLGAGIEQAAAGAAQQLVMPPQGGA